MPEPTVELWAAGARVGAANPLPVSAVPAGGATQTDVAASSGNVANAVATATLAGVAGKTTYLSGFTITGAGATTAAVVLVTVTGLVGGTQTFVVAVPAGSSVGIDALVVDLARPLPAAAPNTAITVSAPAFGMGNTNAAVTARGYQL